MLPSRMRSAPHDSFSLPVRLLTCGGLAGLAALTLADPGATRMWSTPWTFVFAAVLATPGLILGLRTLATTRPFRLPASGWLSAILAAAAVPLASALVSPWRAPTLLLAAVPVSAAAFFFVLQDWLAAVPERNPLVLSRVLAGAAALVAAVSFGLWLVDVAVATQTHDFITVLTVWRNPHPLGHSNYTAGLMLLSLPWLLLAVWRDRGWPRAVAAIGACLALANLFTSGSRGGLLGLAALGAGGVVLARLGWKRLVFYALATVVAAALLAVANPRIRGLLQPADPAAGPDASRVQRAAMFEAGRMMGNDRPLLGWGPGATPLVYPHYRHALEGGTENALQLHNAPVQLWAETGAAGLLAAAAMGLLVIASWRRSPVAAVTLTGYAVFSLTDYQLDVPVFPAAISALLALLARPAAAPATRSVRLGVTGVTLACIVVILAFGQRNPAPRLNVAALALAREPAQHDRAVALLNESLRLNPDQEIAHFNLGWLLVVPDPAAAEKHFLAAAHLVPDKGGVYFGLGLARLNQGKRDGAARALALECLNEPLFLASPWWNVREIAALREATAMEYYRMMVFRTYIPWVDTQQLLLSTQVRRFGQASPGPEKNYRRERIGYPVLMHDLDLPVPVDLYDVREDPRFPGSVPFLLPSKGWLPSSRLLNLLDAP